MPSKNKILAMTNTLFFFGMLAVNVLANALPINNLRTGEISDRYPNLFAPAGFTFSIWGIIYLALAVFVGYQLVRAWQDRSGEQTGIHTIALLFAITCLANALWIIAWHYELLLVSLFMMLILLVSLVMIYLKLGIGTGSPTKPEKFFVQIPFSIYLGWITVATIANVTAVLVGAGWNRFGLSGQFWAISMIAAAGVISLIMLLRRKDVWFSLVIIWALAGILCKRLNSGADPTEGVVIAAICSIAVLSFGILWNLLNGCKINGKTG